MIKINKKGNKKRKSDLKRLEDKMQLLYKGWGEKLYCPSLKKDVYFTAMGWNHLRAGKRTKQEIIRRLKLLPLAKRLIEKFDGTPTNHKRDYKGKLARYIKLEDCLDNLQIVVMITKIEEKYVFVSVFERDNIQ